MICRISRYMVVLSFLLVAWVADAEERETRSYPLPDHGSIQLKVPKSWQDKVSQPPNRLPPTIVFIPKSGTSFQILLTPIWAARPGIVMPGPTEIKQNVERAADKAKSQSVEKDLPIKELKGGSIVGYYFSATDRAPKPGEFKYLTQGMLRLGEFVLTFTVLTNDGAEGVIRDALVMLKEATHVQDQASSTATNADPSKTETIQVNEIGSDYVLSVPVSRLIMTLPKGGLSQKKSAVGGSTDNPRYFYFEDRALHLIISGWFEPEQRFAGIKKSWADETNAWRQKGLPEPRDVSFVKLGNWDGIVYDIQIPNGTNSHIRAHWLQAGTWIDIHLSITSNRPSLETRAKLESLPSSCINGHG